MSAAVNAADPVAVKRQQDKARRLAEVQTGDVRELLKLPSFRRFLWRHMSDTCGLLRSASSPNGSTQSINIGMQDVGRALWAEVESVDPLAIPTMMVEYNESLK